MHIIQSKLLALANNNNLSSYSLRGMASAIGLPRESPQKIKHHLLQLQKKGFIQFNTDEGFARSNDNTPRWANGLLNKTSRLLSIPIIGTANCGPASLYAEENFEGFLKISNKLIKKNKPDGLFAIKADGKSMNRAEIDGKNIEDGDYIIVDKNNLDATDNSVVLVIIENKATVKRIIKDSANEQVVLRSDSSFDYEPIYLHRDDDFLVNGKVIQVIKKPKYK